MGQISPNAETEESGPIQNSRWDTRTRENSRWCSGCGHWIRVVGRWTGGARGSLDDRLKYHQKEYCKQHPDYSPMEEQE